MKSLLNKDSSIPLHHTKWFRSIEESHIEMKDQIYNLMKTENKREFTYNEDGLAIDTRPFKVVGNNKINSK